MSTFSHQVQQNSCTIKMCEILSKDKSADFKNQINSWLLISVETFMLDFEVTTLIEHHFYQALLQFKSILKNNSKSIFSINLNTTLLKQVKQDGMENAFSPVETKAEVQRKAGMMKESKGKIDLEFIGPFLKGTKSAFEVQCNTPIQPLKPYIKTAPVENLSIAGVLSLQSDNFQGTVILSFPEKTFLQVYENMFGEKQAEITKESEDAAGELLNIIYGAAKMELNQKGYNFPKSLPTILRGEKLTIRQTSGATTVILPFESSAGIFYLEIESEKT